MFHELLDSTALLRIKLLWLVFMLTSLCGIYIAYSVRLAAILIDTIVRYWNLMKLEVHVPLK